MRSRSRRRRSVVSPTKSQHAALLALMLLLVLPSAAWAGLDAGVLELSMYGRVGLAWSPISGQIIQGASMNLLGNSIGGRFEEGDYLEPTIRLHILRSKEEEPDSPYVQLVLTPAMFARNGSFIGVFLLATARRSKCATSSP